MSLRNKIFIAVTVPLFFFIVLGALKLNMVYSHYANSQDLLKGMDVYRLITKLIHFTQIERGKTGGYIAGGLPLATLKTQWTFNDNLIEKVRVQIDKMPFGDYYKTEFKSHLDSYKTLRIKVENGSLALKDAIFEYSKLVKFFINYNRKLSGYSLFGAASAKISTLQALEGVKEYAGKLRANLTSAISKDEPLSTSLDTKLQWLSAGVLVSINSSTLVFDDKGAKLKRGFIESEEWTYSYQTLKDVLELKNEGSFGVDPKIFFKTITKAIDKLNMLIDHQLNSTYDEVQKGVDEDTRILTTYSIGIFIITCFAFGMSIFLSSRLVKDLSLVTGDITSNVDHIRELVKKVSASSRELSISTDQQVSSMQETSSSMHQIDSMVKRNTEDSRVSSEVAEQNFQNLQVGVDKINQLTRALGEINTNTERVEGQVTESNVKMEEIAAIIRGIGEKTKVINDIVFQTKLLSFNASVEAERAGENGKGFAVVAEEIGSLAQMSGNASTEIDKLLDDSIKSVERVVNEQKSQMTSIIGRSKESVTHGLNVGKESQEFLSSLLGSMDGLKKNVSQISVASDEQAKGVEEITKAIHSVNEATRNNSQIVVDSKNVSNELNRNIDNFISVVDNLESIVGTKN